MRLNVPLLRQKKKSMECGVVGLEMILAYYGDEGEVECNVHKNGTYAPQLGSVMLKRGYDVEIVTMHPKLFTIADRGLYGDELIPKLEKIKKKAKRKTAINYFIKFLEDGGKIRAKIPDADDIKEEIGAGRPLCALLTSNFLRGKTSIFNFHFNVVTGIDKNYVYVNDPLWDRRGGKQKYKINDFFYGVYASAYGELDNACLMKIRKL